MGRIKFISCPCRLLYGDPMAICPVCKMTVDEATAEFKTEHGGETYYFCSKGCLEEFKANPGKYAGGHTHHGHGACC